MRIVEFLPDVSPQLFVCFTKKPQKRGVSRVRGLLTRKYLQNSSAGRKVEVACQESGRKIDSVTIISSHVLRLFAVISLLTRFFSFSSSLLVCLFSHNIHGFTRNAFGSLPTMHHRQYPDLSNSLDRKEKKRWALKRGRKDSKKSLSTETSTVRKRRRRQQRFSFLGVSAVSCRTVKH